MQVHDIRFPCRLMSRKTDTFEKLIAWNNQLTIVQV